MNNYLINIQGPTAIGKTSLSIKIAKHFKTEIISADSRQFYKEMSIGTAVPSAEELGAVPQHFIQHISVEDSYSVGDFEREAMSKINALFTRHQVLVLVGGSGLYTQSITEGLDDFPDVDPAIREKLNETLKKEGIDVLQKRLYILDPEYYKTADVQNPHRIIRALEVCLSTGKTFSKFLNKKKKQRAFTAVHIGLNADRELIYDRINTRVDLMLKVGLLEEARKLYPQRDLNALNTVGYKELFAYFENETTLETAIAEIKKNTRRFAKRQLTWFKKNPEIKWFEHDTQVTEIIKHIERKINS